MDILNNSIVDTVIEYANVKFGVELEKDAVASNLKELSYSQTLSLVDAIKDEDNEKFTDFVDLSAVNEGWSILPDIDREKYQERDGLEGPIMTKSGKVVYYDPKEGNYYDPDKDMYITYDEWKALDEGVWDAAKNIASKVGNVVKNVVTPGAVKKARQTKSIGKQGSLAKQINMPGFGESEEINELQTPITAQGAMSAASMRKANNGNAQRRANNSQQDANRDATGAGRTVAGGNKQATGQGAARYDKRQDPDDVQRGQNAQAAGQAQQMAANNSQEIARLRDLIQGRR